jgi:large subunit ribosomal protein L31e
MKEESEVKDEKTGESEETEPTEEAVEEIEEAEETLEKEEEVEEAVEEKEVEEELPPVEEEEIEPSARKEVEEEIVEEKFYTISLGKAWIAVPKKRAPRAMKIIKDFVKRHMKFEARGELEEEEEELKRLVVSNEVNERVWRRGIQKPPRKVRVRAAKDKDGNVTVYLAEGE